MRNFPPNGACRGIDPWLVGGFQKKRARPLAQEKSPGMATLFLGRFCRQALANGFCPGGKTG
jgi:hypothetical protein